MKKLIALILVLMLAGLIAFAENGADNSETAGMDNETAKETPVEEIEEVIPSIEGVVVEITEEGLVVQAGENGVFLVKSDDETVLDTSAEIAVGDYIHVVYDGIMSRSIPAQITADLIRMYSISGKIIAADPEVSGVLLETQTHGEVYAYLPEPWLENTAETLVVYFDGAMTMSLPPQISADYVVSLG